MCMHACPAGMSLFLWKESKREGGSDELRYLWFAIENEDFRQEHAHDQESKQMRERENVKGRERAYAGQGITYIYIYIYI